MVIDNSFSIWENTIQFTTETETGNWIRYSISKRNRTGTVGTGTLTGTGSGKG